MFVWDSYFLLQIPWLAPSLGGVAGQERRPVRPRRHFSSLPPTLPFPSTQHVRLKVAGTLWKFLSAPGRVSISPNIPGTRRSSSHAGRDESLQEYLCDRQNTSVWGSSVLRCIMIILLLRLAAAQLAARPPCSCQLPNE